MKVYCPPYYQTFRCIAGDCPDSCCHEWQVAVDEASAARYCALEGALGDALRSALYDEEGCTLMRNQNGRCPMWRDDGLCRIQAELGEGALCDVCRDFPRLRQDYGDFVELSLEMSCPEAARIMLGQDFPGLTAETVPGGDEPDYDGEIMEILKRSRSQAFAILGLTAYSVPQRLAMLLLYGYEVQGQIDGGESFSFDPDSALQDAEQFAGKGNFEDIQDFLLELEILTERWREKLTGSPTPCAWTEEFARLAAYGVYRYWYQTVSDWDLAARVKLVLLHCITARYLAGSYPISVIQLFSKEIENDADNIGAILDAAYTHPALTDRNLLGLMLQKDA